MNRYDFIYFYRDKNKNQIPISTGSTTNLSMVLWRNKSLKKDLHLAGCKSDESIFIFIDGQTFLVTEAPSV